MEDGWVVERLYYLRRGRLDVCGVDLLCCGLYLLGVLESLEELHV